MKVSLARASALLLHSHPVAIPTETVWGLAARLVDEPAIRQIFFLKGRPLENPLIIHLSSPQFLFSCCTQEPPALRELARVFWPGGLTLVVPVDGKKVPALARAGLPTAAFRIPDHPDTLRLIKNTGPLVAPSANRSGSPSATAPKHITNDFGSWLPILQTKEYCRHGIESTILIWQQDAWHIGRLGAISADAIATVLGYTPALHTPHNQPLCPGQLFRHYAPQAKLTLSTEPWNEALSAMYDGVLGYSDRQYPGARRTVALGHSTDPALVAQSLYAALRDLDRFRLQSVFVDINIPLSAEWLAVHDRLAKAAAPRQ